MKEKANNQQQTDNTKYEGKKQQTTLPQMLSNKYKKAQIFTTVTGKKLTKE